MLWHGAPLKLIEHVAMKDEFMKIQTKKSITRFELTFLALLTVFVWVAGCATQPHPDPLAGWQGDFNEQPDQAIEIDYHDYIQTLPLEERKYAGVSDWLKDGKGQHSIVITIGLNGTWWRHVLIYDKNDKRIEVIKYSTGSYRS
jgi:hypothetical protein